MSWHLGARALPKLSWRFPRDLREAGAMQIDPGAVALLAPDGERIGFGYFEPTERGTVRERWLLFQGTKDDFSIVAAPLLELLTPTRDAWERAVRAAVETREGYTYIKAISEAFTYGDAGWETRIPDERLPVPLDPRDEARRRVVPHQTDSGGRIFQRDVLSGHVRAFHAGYVAAADAITVDDSVEYWMLFDGFVPAGALLGPATRIDPVRSRAASAEEFAREMQDHWREGARFVITGCANYRGGLPEVL